MTRPTAQHLRLTRTARVAGEAFAFVDPESGPAARRWPLGGIAALFAVIGLIAAAYLAF